MLSEAIDELKVLKLGPMAVRLKEWADDPGNQGKSHTECVSALALAQIQVRNNKRAHTLLASAGLPASVSIHDVHQRAFWGLPSGTLGNLATCDWIGQGHTVVVTGASYSGKTSLAAALIREAAQLGISMAYWRLPELLTACAIERQKNEAALSIFMKRLAKPKLLVLDDFAMEVSDRPQCYALRQLLDARARQNRALMIVSPNAFEHWKDYFEDPSAAEAIFARVLSKSWPVSLTRSSPSVG
jgi:DNA replication protein DnaC